MARFNANEADNYGGQGGGGFFSISDDRGTKRVRFLYNKEEDMEGFSVHKVDVNGKERYVNCLRDYRDPIDKCPFCRENKKTQVKLFIPLYNEDEKQVQIWDRGKKMFAEMSSLFSRYAVKEDLCQHIFEVERRGKPKDTSTTYGIFEVDKDDTTLDEFEDSLPKILGGLVLDKSADDMEYYLETDEFPPEDEDEDEKPKRRSSSRRGGDNEDADDEEDERPKGRSSSRTERRTPRRGDRY